MGPEYFWSYMLKQHAEIIPYFPMLNQLLSNSSTSPLKIIQFHFQNNVSILFPPPDKPEHPQITCLRKMIINPFRKLSAHPDIIPIPSNIWPSPEIIARNPGDKSLFQETIFRAHAGPGALGTPSKKARIFSQEVRWDKENMDQSAVSQGNKIKSNGSVSGESRRWHKIGSRLEPIFTFYVNLFTYCGISVLKQYLPANQTDDQLCNKLRELCTHS